MAADPGNEKVIQMLFKTGAVRVCQEGKPFWYTSGTIGPYYINTHFLLDGEKQAQSLLDFIDGELQNRSGLPGRLLVRVKQVYDRNGVFRQLMDLLTEKVQTMLPSDAYDAVSGGERRDWLFSLMAAVLLQKPHVTFYKDLSAVLTHGPDHDRDEPGVDLGTAGPGPVHGMRLLHIADLLNEASSFTRAWIPAARALQARMDDALVIVDRGQGGKALLSEAGTRLHTLAAAGDEMFQRAFSLGWV
ncbi:MAG TPA: orotate phosphoribosyltransferase, partial [Clostridiales bacterium]|nr:orotate phosphoribosyltransferase [Clostridiales bacterium]